MNMFRYLKRIAGILLLLGFVSLGTISAQPDTTRHHTGDKYGGVGYVSLGYQMLDLDPVSQRINQSSFSYATLPDRFVSFGGGGHVFSGSWLIGGEGQGFSGSNAAPNAYDINIDGGYGFFNLGYRVVGFGSTNITPILGIGGGGYEMTIYQSLTDPNFDRIISQPQRQSTLSASNMLLKASTELSHAFYRSRSEKNQQKTSILTLHMRVGYIFAPVEGTWELAGQTLDGSPSTGMEGPFFRLSVGFGGH